jgi:hypothetical protein
MQTKHKASHFWILGGGRFGQRAAAALHRRYGDSEITLIEKNGRTCRRLEKEGLKTVCREGVRYLEMNLRDIDTPEWVVPAIPLHVAFEWVRAKLSRDYVLQALDIPDRLARALPNPMAGTRGQLFVSNADFLCPESCSEPDEICTVTGIPRPRILHEHLARIQAGAFTSVVICSRQLAAGVGGYRSRALFQVLDKITSIHGPVLLSTACRCHGVSNLFAISRRQ